ncbi:MAG TPA: hypothetical protein VKB67_02060 [Rhizomicrobium sp.]|nr:hypothetical protein [Rhizomicrobium sp.]
MTEKSAAENAYMNFLATSPPAVSLSSLESVILTYLHYAFSKDVVRVEIAMHLREHIRDGAANLEAHLRRVATCNREAEAAERAIEILKKWKQQPSA